MCLAGGIRALLLLAFVLCQRAGRVDGKNDNCKYASLVHFIDMCNSREVVIFRMGVETDGTIAYIRHEIFGARGGCFSLFLVFMDVVYLMSVSDILKLSSGYFMIDL